MHARSTIAVAVLTAVPAIAQFPLQGFLYNWDRPALGSSLSVSVRWGATAEQVLQRIDRRDYVDWGVNAAGDSQMQGFVVWIGDANDTTRETFSLVGYEEDPATPDFPLLAAPRVNIAGIPMPPTGTPPGGRTYRLGFGLTLPVTFAATRDVFLGIGLPAMISATAPLDGLFVGSTNNDPLSAPAPFDVAGPTAATVGQGSYICYVPVGQPARYLPPTATSLEQLAFDVTLSSGVVGGVALTSTAQTSYPSSNGQGTSNFLSGLHPDIGRGDDVGFAITANTAQVPTGSTALVLLGFGPSPFGTVPLNVIGGIDPSSVGNVCVDFTTAQPYFTTVNTGGLNSIANMVEGRIIYPVSAAERAVVASMVGPIDVWWQGFVVDPTFPGLKVRSTGCVVQHIK